MKILFVDQSGNLYGSERGLLTLLSKPDLSQFEPVVACPDDGPLWQELTKLDIPLERMEFNTYSWGQRPDWQFKFLFKFIALIRRHRPDAVVINFEGNVPLMILGSRLAGCPVIRMLKREVRPQSSDAQGYQINLTDRASFLGSHGVICISGAVEKQLRHALGVGLEFPAVTLFDPQELTCISEEEIRVRRQSLGIAPDALVVGEFARINPIKGIDILIRSAPMVLEKLPDVQFLIVGEIENPVSGPEYRNELKELAQNLGVADKIIWTGFVPDPLVVMAACDIIALPTRAEGLGRVLIEAWSVKRPVVASRTDGPEEVIRLSGGGLLHAIDDPVDLAHQLIQLLSSPDQRAKLATLGWEWVKQTCNPDYYRAQFAAFVRQFIEMKPNA